MSLSRRCYAKDARAMLGLAACAAAMLLSTAAYAVACPAPTRLGPSPTRLVVVVPAIEQGPKQWESFLERLKGEPESRELAWLVFDHDTGFLTTGSAAEIARNLSGCIKEKIRADGYTKVTLIGHSMGGMVARRAYLLGANALPDEPASEDPWADKVDRILLFASVNKGIRPEARHFHVPLKPVMWTLRAIPHPRLVFEDMFLGSDFIANVRIAWIRHLGKLHSIDNASASAAISVPHVVQFWGAKDSIVTKMDNADLEAFGGNVQELHGADHGSLHRLEKEFADDPEARWKIFKHQMFQAPSNVRLAFPERRVLFVLRGIRDSANSEWVKDLVTRGESADRYGKDNVEGPDYGYFSAAQFAVRPVRAKNIPNFRDLYAEKLAENPRTKFDIIGHSNGTYILGHSLLSTPSMQFQHVVLAAPVLPTDFNWKQLFGYKQVKAVRYDAAANDYPVGILCQALRALGFDDVGPAGVVGFGAGGMSTDLTTVAWYDGDHSAALLVDPASSVDNRAHLLNFAWDGRDDKASSKLTKLGAMQHYSRATPYVVWTVFGLLCVWLFRRQMQAGFSIASLRAMVSPRKLAWVTALLVGVYAVLDIL